MEFLQIYAVLAVCYFMWVFPHIHHHKLLGNGSIPAELITSLVFACTWPLALMDDLWRFFTSKCKGQ
ncbi:hypothetical protein [Bowmanella sp. JS7-9]|uniref:Uncharacterized protein n=1 Tax=Pseudobowmanella zhangzhouensis TaxID=1537679 RepID=A0ABW1XKM0_9ALTE|nr:hypothetical protein [Bowmanella sp. JS7-9]TBX27304.1 hypothetical protein TK45_00690 [Bowmanella sp. JS7-9]